MNGKLKKKAAGISVAAAVAISSLGFATNDSVTEAFEQKGFTTSIDNSDPENLVFVAEKENIKIEIPENKDVAYVTQNNKSYEKELNGVAVYNGEDFFVSENALNMSK